MEKIVLKASAGTGKTYRLSLEYISALLKGSRPENILVMTFTRKATSEIKARILLFLQQISAGTEKGQEIAANISELYPELPVDAETVKKIYMQILSVKDSLKIFTIDSFINLIFRAAVAPYKKINTYQIIEDEENREVLNKVLKKIAENRSEFNTFKSFFLENVEKSWENYIDALLPLFYERWKFILLEESEIIKDRAFFEVKPVVEEFESLINSVKELCLMKGVEPSPENLFKKKFQDYPFNGSYKDKDGFIFERAKSFLDEKYFWKIRSCKKCKESFEEAVEAFDDFCINLSREYFNREIIPYERDIFNLIKKIYTSYDEIKFKEKKFTHGDISNYTFSYLKDPKLNLIGIEGVTEYFYNLIDSRAETLFIDEFQDTSILQWKILKNLIEKAEKVICVGDEKQSIYGWRGGEKKLFERLESIIAAEERKLTKCYRSEFEIIDFTNAFFSTLSASGSWNFSKTKGDSSRDKGYIEIIAPDEEEEGTEKLISLLIQEFKGNYKGVAVLSRTNKQLGVIGEKLSEAGIPFVLESNEEITKHRAVAGIYKLLKYIRYDNIFYLLEFLRSDLICISSPLMKRVIEYLNSEETKEYPEEIRDILERIGAFKEKLSSGNSPLSENLFEILKSFGILDRFKNSSDLKNLYRFYEILGEYSSLEEFFTDYESNTTGSKFRQVSTEENNAVTLMSIHKSKGLEFETVIYYHKLGRAPSGGKKINFMIQMDEAYERVTDYLLSNNSHLKVLNLLKDEFKFIADKESKDIEEEFNNLYVALTRAKNNLYIIPEGKDDTFKKVLEVLPSVSGTKVPTEPPAYKEIEKDTFNLEIDFSPAEPEEIEENAKSHISLDREFKRITGTAIHYYLENILYGEPEEIEASKQLTLSNFGSTIGEARLKKILESSQLKKVFKENSHIFSHEWDMIYPEYEVYHENSLKRMDRVMIKKPEPGKMGKIHIIDYKTGLLDEDQLKGYKDIIENYLVSAGEAEQYNVTTEFLAINYDTEI